MAGEVAMSDTIPGYDLTTGVPSGIETGDILNIPYSGREVSITLPKGKYKLECWGAQGGYRSSSTYGGKGGKSVGIIALNKETQIYIFAGGAGNTGKTNGGFNGGGKRNTYNGGGGSSDIRIGSNSLYARVIVAGGGGSDGATDRGGGAGGGTTGQDTTASNFGTGGSAGTQTGNNGGYAVVSSEPSGTSSQSDCYAGFGFGGNGVATNSGYGGAGGGGWYGGVGTFPDGSGDDDKGGGGGSGYIYTASTAANYPSGCLLDSSMYLDSASTKSGTESFYSPSGSSETGHSGDGYARITVIEAQPSTKFYLKINGAWKVVA